MTLDLHDYVASIPDYPEKGVLFRDISPLMADGEAYHQATDQIVQFARDKGVEMIVGPEARGFIVGCPVAFELGVGFPLLNTDIRALPSSAMMRTSILFSFST